MGQMTDKTCSQCKNVKPISDFYIRNASSDGLRPECKQCTSTKAANYRMNNKNILAKKKSEYNKINKDKINKRRKEYFDKNPDAHNARLEYMRQWRSANKDYMAKYERERKKIDPAFKIARNLRTRLYYAVQRGQKAGSFIKDLGCSVEYLKSHLEAQFQPDMSWDNYGEWHIDHIKPLSSFDLTDRNQFLEACHYTNLQPLWAKDNLSKGASI